MDALSQVLVVGQLLGAGLPSLLALGLRSLNTGNTVAVGGGGYGTNVEASQPSRLGLAGAVVCFTIAVLAVAFAIVVINFGNNILG